MSIPSHEFSPLPLVLFSSLRRHVCIQMAVRYIRTLLNTDMHLVCLDNSWTLNLF